MRIFVVAVIAMWAMIIGNVYAKPIVRIPVYAKNFQEKCACGCDGKIALQQLPTSPKNLQQWSKEAAVAIYSYGFGNYEAALKQASRYFTRRGWHDFTLALQQSGDLQAVIEKNVIVSARVTGPVSMGDQFLWEGQAAWEATLPLTVEYANIQGTKQAMLNVRLVIIQENNHPGTRGLGIERIVVTPKKA